MDDRDELIEISERLAGAIARRDTNALRGLLAKGFTQRSAGGEGVGADAFLEGVTQIPGEILFVKVDQLTVDLLGDGAVVTGIQQAQLTINGAIVIDRRSFVDWFVRESGEWRLRVAVDIPSA